jgi:outer membrane lipoprotein
MKLETFWVLGLMVLTTACASAIPKEALRQVDPEVTFQGLINDPERYKGKVILVGGQIVSITVREGESWVEVLQQPLDWKQRPKATDVSYGRFLICFEGFLDPAIYAEGKKITVLGEVQGKKVQPLNEMEYIYPVLLPREHYLWKPETYGGPSIHFGIGLGGVIR